MRDFFSSRQSFADTVHRLVFARVYRITLYIVRCSGHENKKLSHKKLQQGTIYFSLSPFAP